MITCFKREGELLNDGELQNGENLLAVLRGLFQGAFDEGEAALGLFAH